MNLVQLNNVCSGERAEQDTMVPVLEGRVVKEGDWAVGGSLTSAASDEGLSLVLGSPGGALEKASPEEVRVELGFEG